MSEQNVNRCWTPCCGHEIDDKNPPVYWNPYNRVFQCHVCGHIYTPNTHEVKAPITPPAPKAEEVCRQCQGVGYLTDNIACVNCHGTGKKPTPPKPEVCLKPSFKALLDDARNTPEYFEAGIDIILGEMEVLNKQLRDEAAALIKCVKGGDEKCGNMSQSRNAPKATEQVGATSPPKPEVCCEAWRFTGQVIKRVIIGIEVSYKYGAITLCPFCGSQLREVCGSQLKKEGE